MQSKRIIREGYISELDEFLREFDRKQTTFSDARIQEYNKAAKIAAKRDGKVEEPESYIWEGF